MSELSDKTKTKNPLYTDKCDRTCALQLLLEGHIEWEGRNDFLGIVS